MDNRVSSILRRSNLIDTSGAEPPAMVGLRLEGGVYTSPAAEDATANSILTGRITLGMIGIAIIAAVAFFYYTRSIQGGG